MIVNNQKVKNRKTGQRLIGLIGAICIAVLVVANILLVGLGVNAGLYLDMTPEGLYTLTDTMKDQLSYLDELRNDERKLKITFCTDPDYLIASQSMRIPYFMAIDLANTYDVVEVETVNVAYNPTAVSKYKATSLSEITSSDIIVSYGDRYRVVSLQSFWVADSDNVVWAYNGEYKMASIIMSVTSKNRPKAYFVTGHGETYYDTTAPESATSLASAYLYDLLTERGLEIKTVDLSEVDKVPDDCVLLVINNPTSDYVSDPDRLDEYSYVSETEKLDRYLVSDHGALMVAKDHTVTLPNLEAFLYDWGFDIGTDTVSDETNYLVSEDGGYGKVLGVYDGDSESYGAAIYESFTALGNGAPSMVFDDTGHILPAYGDTWSAPEAGTYAVSRNYAPLFYTTSSAKSYEVGAGGALEVNNEGIMHLAGVTTRLEIDSYTAEYKYSYVFAAPSGGFFSNEMLGNTSYANYDIVSALVENISRVDEYASIELGGTSYNSPNLGGKPFLETDMSSSDVYDGDVIAVHGVSTTDIVLISVLLLAIPLVVLAVGVAVRIRRKFL